MIGTDTKNAKGTLRTPKQQSLPERVFQPGFWELSLLEMLCSVNLLGLETRSAALT